MFVEFNVSLLLNFNQSHYFSCGEWLSISMLVWYLRINVIVGVAIMPLPSCSALYLALAL